MNIKTLSVFLTALSVFLVPSLVYAGTTLETVAWCRYSNAQGKEVFSGKCLVNWGVGGAAGCSEQTNLAERYILRFTPEKEVWIYIYCNDSATILYDEDSVSGNKQRGIVTRGWKDEKRIYHVLTEKRDIFEFEEVRE